MGTQKFTLTKAVGAMSTMIKAAKKTKEEIEKEKEAKAKAEKVE